MVIDTGGTVVSRTRYLPFGNPWTQEFFGGLTALPTDKLFPPEAGRHRPRAQGRRQRPLLRGRALLQRRPGALPVGGRHHPRRGRSQALNRYAYVRNNPMRYTDPTGMRRMDNPGGNGCTAYTCAEELGSEPASPPPRPRGGCLGPVCITGSPTPFPTVIERLLAVNNSAWWIMNPYGVAITGGEAQRGGAFAAIPEGTYQMQVRVRVYQQNLGSAAPYQTQVFIVAENDQGEVIGVRQRHDYGFNVWLKPENGPELGAAAEPGFGQGRLRSPMSEGAEIALWGAEFISSTKPEAVDVTLVPRTVEGLLLGTIGVSYNLDSGEQHAITSYGLGLNR